MTWNWFFSPLELCVVFSDIHNKGLQVYFVLVLTFSFHVDGFYSIVFSLSYQVSDLNINNDALSSELCELLGISYVYAHNYT